MDFLLLLRLNPSYDFPSIPHNSGKHTRLHAPVMMNARRIDRSRRRTPRRRPAPACCSETPGSPNRPRSRRPDGRGERRATSAICTPFQPDTESRLRRQAQQAHAGESGSVEPEQGWWTRRRHRAQARASPCSPRYGRRSSPSAYGRATPNACITATPGPATPSHRPMRRSRDRSRRR